MRVNQCKSERECMVVCSWVLGRGPRGRGGCSLELFRQGETLLKTKTYKTRARFVVHLTHTNVWGSLAAHAVYKRYKSRKNLYWYCK